MTAPAEVLLWGRRIGAVLIEDGLDVASFQYDPDFVSSGIQVSPLSMPLANQVYRFSELPVRSFHGLPGLLADSLPDRFGNALINAWLATQGRSPESFDAVERLCYTGARGMGALEFKPATGPAQRAAVKIEVDKLVELASLILGDRQQLRASLAEPERQEAMQQILRVGTSAGGARAKALIAWNPGTDEVRSGQVEAGSGFQHWLLKFDGVENNRDKELNDPKGYTTIEYAYSLMARDAGIHMSECRMLEEGGRRHFMTRRFDRSEGGKKLHMQSLGALAHLDYNDAGAHSYEQALLVIRRLDLGMEAIEQQFRRMVFNVVARNQDDHVKNIAFLMNKAGHWQLSPAFDVTYSYNPEGEWTGRHQMSINGKRDDFSREDFRACARSCSMQRGRADEILDEVRSVVGSWRDYAGQADVLASIVASVARAHRLDW